MSCRQSSESGHSISLLLQSLSSYLNELAEQVHAVEHAISDQLCLQKSQDLNPITQLQNLDYLRQSLKDLAILTSMLEGINFEGTIASKNIEDILQKLTLNDTKALVCPTFTHVGFTHSGDGFGDIDLF